MRLIVATTVGRTVAAFLEPQLRALHGRGHTIDLLCTCVDELGSFPTEIDATVLDAPWTRPLRPWKLPSVVLSARRILDVERPDVIYTHTAIASTVLRLATLLQRRNDKARVVYCAHGFAGAAVQPWWRRIGPRTVERLLARTTDTIIVMNDEDEEWARGLRTSHVVRVPSVGLDVDVLRGRFGEASVRNPPSGEFVELLVLAELSTRKRVHLAIEAMTHLPPLYRLSIAGDGPLRSTLEAKAAHLEPGRVRFLGHVADPGQAIVDADLLVSTSRQEGLARSILESFALGTPVVALGARGVSDVLSTGGGVIAAGDSPNALATAIRDLAESPDDYSRAVEQAREIVERHRVEVVTPAFIAAVEG